MYLKNHYLVLIVFFTIVFQFFCASAQNIKGKIDNYSNQPLVLYQCHLDSLILRGSLSTDEKGKFSFANDNLPYGLYKVILKKEQFFYLLIDGKSIEIETTFLHSPFYNIATDSLKVIRSEENKLFYEFQKAQQQLNVANHWLLQMMRLFPLPDPFHPNIEKEYFDRYERMKVLVDQSINNHPEKLSTKLIKAYYQPINPDWKQPDPWRDSLIAAHYFDHFDPSDDFYLQTNILIEKIDIYLDLKTNKRDSYGQPIKSEKLFSDAAIDFLKETVNHTEIHQFCLNYILKKFDDQHMETAFIEVYDRFLKVEDGDCGNSEQDQFLWARQEANLLRGVQIGSVAPDFQLMEGKLNLHRLQSEYTLLIFWATWCPHCVIEIPKIKQETEQYNAQQLMSVAVSLDTLSTPWQTFIEQNELQGWLNYSELKGWKSSLVRRYNVYATPSMFLLDENKKIVAKPTSLTELKGLLAGRLSK